MLDQEVCSFYCQAIVFSSTLWSVLAYKLFCLRALLATCQNFARLDTLRSTMEPNTKPPIDWRSFMLCVIIAMGQFVGAYGTVIIGTTIGKVDFNTRMGLQDHEGRSTHNATALKGAITGLYQVCL